MLGNKFVTLSKSVGWTPRTVSYPCLLLIKVATDYKILEWYRFLPSPQNAEEEEKMNLISTKFTELSRG